jgi:hypothetical protein
MLLFTQGNRLEQTRKIIKPRNPNQNIQTKLLLENIRLNLHPTHRHLGTILKNKFTITTLGGKMLMMFGRLAKKL